MVEGIEEMGERDWNWARWYIASQINSWDTNTCTPSQVQNATFGSIKIRYIDEEVTTDSDGTGMLNTKMKNQSIASKEKEKVVEEEESFPGF